MMRNKGKVHPFTSSSSSYTPNRESLPVLKLLPAAVFSLISVLSVEDRQVLAYMITRSLNSAHPPSFPSEYKKNLTNKQPPDCHGDRSLASFDCDCFDCYTSFWFRWDSSPNRDVIHQAIEAFEEHLNSGEQLRKGGNSKSKRREKTGRRRGAKTSDEISSTGPPENQENLAGAQLNPAVAEDGMRASPPSAVVHNHRALARKVLPDVMGIFNSRLWHLWSTNA